MDRDGADFDGTLDEIRKRLEANPVADSDSHRRRLAAHAGRLPRHHRPGRDEAAHVHAGEPGATRSSKREIPAGAARRGRAVARRRCSSSSSITRNELAELVLAEEPRARGAGPPGAPRATLHQLIVPVLCGSALDHVGIQPLLDAVAYYLPSPLDVPPVEGINPKKQDDKDDAQARPRRAVLRPGVQDPGRQARRPVLRARLLRRAEGQQPRLQPRQGQEGERQPALAHPGRPPRGAGRRASRPATSSASSA